MITVGSKVKYDPFEDISSYQERKQNITGTVVVVNEKNGWFGAEYNGIVTCFRFSDLGDKVREVRDRRG